MKAALRLLLVTTTLVVAVPAFAEILSTAKPETVDVSPVRLSRIRAVLQQEIDADRMPGAVVMIARRGQLIYSEAIGLRQGRLSMCSGASSRQSRGSDCPGIS